MDIRMLPDNPAVKALYACYTYMRVYLHVAERYFVTALLKKY